MECRHNERLTNEVKIMIRQRAISVQVGETDAAVTNFPGAVGLANLGERLGLFEDLDALLPRKERKRCLRDGDCAKRCGKRGHGARH